MRRLGMTYVREFCRSGLLARSTVVQGDVPFALYEVNRRE